MLLNSLENHLLSPLHRYVVRLLLLVSWWHRSEGLVEVLVVGFVEVAAGVVVFEIFDEVGPQRIMRILPKLIKLLVLQAPLQRPLRLLEGLHGRDDLDVAVELFEEVLALSGGNLCLLGAVRHFMFQVQVLIKNNPKLVKSTVI